MHIHAFLYYLRLSFTFFYSLHPSQTTLDLLFLRPFYSFSYDLKHRHVYSIRLEKKLITYVFISLNQKVHFKLILLYVGQYVEMLKFNAITCSFVVSFGSQKYEY